MPYIQIERHECDDHACQETHRVASCAVAGPHGLMVYCWEHGEQYAAVARAAGWTFVLVPLFSLDQVMRAARA